MILVAGATGYIGDLLARKLLDDGRQVRCLARTPAKASDLEAAGAEIVKGDVLEPESLPAAFEGVDIAYYLVHSMGRGGSGDFAELDHRAAANFGEAAKAAGVSRIIYLGGLGGVEASKHLRSRHETAKTLQASGIPITYFRAAAVIGSGSESFRTVYYLVKRLPVMLAPSWTANRTQPIAVADVLEYLAAAPDVEASTGRTIEIGGPEVTTYAGMMDQMAEALGIRPRRRLSVPVLTPRLSSLWIGLVTPVDAGVAKPLIEGLATDTVVEDPSGMALFDVEQTPVAVALESAVADAD
jgi:uncharacterized protein YbjT (DUF2867 family)